MTVTVLGWLGSFLVVLSLAQRDVRRLRQVSLASAVVLLCFNLVIGIASMVALNVALVLINTYRLLDPGVGRVPRLAALVPARPATVAAA